MRVKWHFWELNVYVTTQYGDPMESQSLQDFEFELDAWAHDVYGADYCEGAWLGLGADWNVAAAEASPEPVTDRGHRWMVFHFPDDNQYRNSEEESAKWAKPDDGPEYTNVQIKISRFVSLINIMMRRAGLEGKVELRGITEAESREEFD